MSVAYLTGNYPKVSHAFILREVESLREIGLAVETLSIRRAGPEQLLSEADRRAFDTTYAVLPPRWGRLAADHLLAAIKRPRRYVETLALALRMSPGGLRATLWQLFYFVE